MKRKNLSLLLAMAMTVTTAMTGLTVNVHAEAIDESTSNTVEQAEVAAVPEVKTEEPGGSRFCTGHIEGWNHL